MGREWKAEFERLKAERGVARDEFRVMQSEGGLFEQLVKSVKEYAMFMLDADGCIASWNPGARRVKQYREEEVIGQHFRMLYTPDDQQAGRPEKNLADAIRYGQTEDIGWRMKRDGSWFWADVLITPVFDRGGRILGYAKVIRDLTDVNKAEAHTRALEATRQVDRLKQQFLALISHELRTPLTTILGYADLIDEESVGPVTDMQHAYLDHILEGAASLTKLINDLIDMTSLQAGLLHLDLAPMSLAEVVLGVVFAIQPHAQEKHLWLANHVSPDLPDIVADAQRVAQILVHFIDNAIKFSPHGGRIDIQACLLGDMVRCEVTDTGKGVAPEDMEKLFQDFSQVDMSATRTEGGLGIGLSISKKLVEAHGGQVGILSAVGKGSTVWFTLPLSAERAIQSQPTPPSTNTTPP